MNKGINFKKGYRHEIIKLLYQCGIIPYRCLQYIGGPPQMYQRAVKDLEKKGYVVVDKKGGERNIRLRNRQYRKEEYEPYLPAKYIEYYETKMYGPIGKISEKDKYSIAAKKIIKDSATQVMMYASGFRIGAEKSELSEKGIEVDQPTYYSSSEIKGIEGTTKKNQTSRINGVLASEGGLYPLYNIGNTLIKWERIDEVKMSSYVNSVVRRKSLPGKIKPAGEKECIVIAMENMLYSKICNLDYSKKNQKQTRLINIDYSYNHVYAVPENRNGIKMLQIMVQENWKEQIYNSLLTDHERESAQQSGITCDGYREKEKEYIYVFCIPDLVRLKMFIARANLENDKKRFKIYCFTHQTSIIHGIIDRNIVTIMQIDMDAYIAKYLPV